MKETFRILQKCMVGTRIVESRACPGRAPLPFMREHKNHLWVNTNDEHRLKFHSEDWDLLLNPGQSSEVVGTEKLHRGAGTQWEPMTNMHKALSSIFNTRFEKEKQKSFCQETSEYLLKSVKMPFQFPDNWHKRYPHWGPYPSWLSFIEVRCPTCYGML